MLPVNLTASLKVDARGKSLEKILGSESFTRWLIGGEVIHLIHTLKACLNELSLTNSAQSKVLKKAYCYVMRSVHGPQVFFHKVTTDIVSVGASGNSPP